MTYLMARAQQGDLDIVMGILDERIEWLRTRGSDQWSTLPFRPRLARSIAAGETWLLYENGVPSATLSMTTVGSPDFWTHDELVQPALYLSKIATRIHSAGQGIGELLIDWAAAYAQAHQIPRLRWDAWRSNDGLQTYWRRIGAVHVRTVEALGWRTGALFEYAWKMPRASTPVTTQVEDAEVTELPSLLVPRWDTGDDHLYGDDEVVLPSHHHLVPDVLVEGSPLWLAGGGLLLYNPGDGWRLGGLAFPHRPSISGELPDALRTGIPYIVDHETTPTGCHVVIRGDVDIAAVRAA